MFRVNIIPLRPLPRTYCREKARGNRIIRRLVEQTDTHKKVTLRLSPSARFHLPPQRYQPVIMFAGGSGIAPFAGFLHERRRPPEAVNRLYLNVHTRDPSSRIARTAFSTRAIRFKSSIFVKIGRRDLKKEKYM